MKTIDDLLNYAMTIPSFKPLNTEINTDLFGTRGESFEEEYEFKF